MSCQRPKLDAEKWLDGAFESLRWLDHLLRGQETRSEVNQKLAVIQIKEAVNDATDRLQSVVQCEVVRLGFKAVQEVSETQDGITHDKNGNITDSPSNGTI